jgi:hypothetical protein
MAHGATGGVPNHNQATGQASVTDDALFAVLAAPVLHFKRQPLKDNRGVSEIEPSKDNRGVSEIEPSLSESPFTLGRIKTDLHLIIVVTPIS